MATHRSAFLFALGQRVVRLAALHVAALFNEVAHLVRGDRQLTLRANVQSRRGQCVVTSSHALGRLRLPSLGYCHDKRSRAPTSRLNSRLEKVLNYRGSPPTRNPTSAKMSRRA